MCVLPAMVDLGILECQNTSGETLVGGHQAPLPSYSLAHKRC
jgi:hypothetical protein